MNSDLTDFVKLHTNVSNEKLIFLVDSEAKISVIKIESLSDTSNIDQNDTISIRGVTDGRIYTLGSVTIDIHFNNVVFEHKFHVVDNSFDIPTQAILGKDFLKSNGFCINYNDMTVSTTIDGIVIPTNILSELDPMTTVLPRNSKIFRIFHIQSNDFLSLIPAQNIDEHIRIATTIAYGQKTWIRLANISNKTRIVDKC